MAIRGFGQRRRVWRIIRTFAAPHLMMGIKDDAGNGYVWHAAATGKPLNSFKASTLLKLNEHILKCLFAVDRKALNRRTREEFDCVKEGCVEETISSAALVRRLLSDDVADEDDFLSDSQSKTSNFSRLATA